jgi:hypothetical protein
LGGSAVLTFWVAYVLTRPLGASLGDLLTQDKSLGGLGLGASLTSIVFLVVIVVLVVREQRLVNATASPRRAPVRSADGAATSAGRSAAPRLSRCSAWSWRVCTHLRRRRRPPRPAQVGRPPVVLLCTRRRRWAT